jgi:predicted TIM-barrel fold metal-dependent hydrolase
MEDITQELVDQMVVEVKLKWSEMKRDFEGSDVLFAMSKDVLQLLGEYENVKVNLVEMGFNVPNIDDKIQVTLS